MHRIISRNATYTVTRPHGESETHSLEIYEKIVISLILIGCLVTLILIPFIPLIFLGLCTYFREKHIKAFQRLDSEKAAEESKEELRKGKDISKNIETKEPDLTPNSKFEQIIKENLESFTKDGNYRSSQELDHFVFVASDKMMQHDPFSIEKEISSKDGTIVLTFSFLENNEIKNLAEEDKQQALDFTATYLRKFLKKKFSVYNKRTIEITRIEVIRTKKDLGRIKVIASSNDPFVIEREKGKRELIGNTFN